MKKQNKDRLVSVRFTDNEYDFLLNLARRKKVKPSQFLRNSIKSKSVLLSQYEKEIKSLLLFQVNKIGNNLNQLAKKVNSGFADTDLILATLQNIEFNLLELVKK